MLSDRVLLRCSTIKRATFDLSTQSKMAGSSIACTRWETLSTPPALGVSSALAEPITSPPGTPAIA